MAPYLQLDLNSLAIDVRLAKRLSYALSRYYMALPLGQDGSSVTVAMAYPENVKARRILSRFLQAEVVPVFTPTESLLPVLERIHPREIPTSRSILAWYEQAQWQPAITTAAAMLEELLQARATTLAAPEFSLDELLTLSVVSRYELVVLPLPSKPMLTMVLHQAAAPLFFVRGEQQAVRNILLVMRGFASDEQALDWLTPFAGQQQASVTLMPLTNGTGLGFSEYHHPELPAGQHLDRCLKHLAAEGVSVSLKYRQGNAVQQVVEEMVADDYDLLVLAAEAEGGFVGRVIAAVELHGGKTQCPILVVKPPELPGQLDPEQL